MVDTSGKSWVIDPACFGGHREFDIAMMKLFGGFADSAFAAYDVEGDGGADSAYRPNDAMDHILWTQPAAKLLLGSPAVQLMRWAQSAFPALLPGGILDSHPVMQPVEITLPNWESRRDG